MKKTYEFTDQEIDLIAMALSKLPYEIVFQLIENIKTQYGKEGPLG